MSIGERIRFFRKKNRLTQKQLGKLIGYPDSTADIRIAQYESNSRRPKADTISKFAEIFEISQGALMIPNIDNCISLMHLLFTLEDCYGLCVVKYNGKVCLEVNENKGIKADRLFHMLCKWQKEREKMLLGKISNEEYDRWRYRYSSIKDEKEVMP